MEFKLYVGTEAKPKDWVIASSVSEFEGIIDRGDIPEFVEYSSSFNSAFDKCENLGLNPTEKMDEDTAVLKCVKYLLSKIPNTPHPPYRVDNKNVIAHFKIIDLILEHNKKIGPPS